MVLPLFYLFACKPHRQSNSTAQNTRDKNTSAELIELEKARLAALSQLDSNQLKKMVSPDFEFTTSFGELVSLHDLLQNYRARYLAGAREKHYTKSIKVNIYNGGKTAILRGIYVLERVEKGGIVVITTRYTDVYIKNDKNFKEALILIEEGNVQIEYKKAEVINIDKKSFQAKFNIIDKGNIFEYKSMVFLKSNDKSLCAFEEINTKYKESTSNQSNLRGCTWTVWWRVNNSASSGQCWDFGWCWNASKKGRDYEYYRTCNKNGQSTRRQTKWFREDCECR